MARIAIVEAYPYEAVWGGDAVYLDRIRQFLTSHGHSVDSYITNVSRGRASPLVRLHSRATGDHRWILRHAIAWRTNRFLAFDPGFIRKALARMLGHRAAPEREVKAHEQSWLIRKFAGSAPDIVILAFGACRFAKAVFEHGRPVMAIRGFFSERSVRLGEKPETTEPSLDQTMLKELRWATYVGFNNLMDLGYYQRATGSGNGTLMGMSFPQRYNISPSEEPFIIFVGARTKPNIQALQWFIDGAWPRIVAAVPNARLRIVGAVGSAFRPDPVANVEIIGFADDLDAEYGRAQVVVAPLVIGSSGVKTKVAEAFSYGRPLVTTSIGVDPADPNQFGEAVDVADDPAAFASAVIRLLSDAPFRIRRNTMAKEQFDRHFSEEAAYAALIKMLDAVPSCA